MAGGLSKMMEAGCSVIGGHSVRDEEMKFGYSVTGLINPRTCFIECRREARGPIVIHEIAGHGSDFNRHKEGRGGTGMGGCSHHLDDNAE